VLTPVNIVRYFEFAFASTALPPSVGRGLDVSSPRLLSLYLAERRAATVDVINPDRDDAATTQRIARAMHLDRLHVSPVAIADFRAKEPSYDCIWSVSVIEHVRGDDGDTDAIRQLWRLLRPGGALVVTVPVDREHHIERRDVAYYGLDEERDGDGYFFARYYDAHSLRRRLIEAAGVEPTRIAWFGERRRGHYAEYEERWRQHGHRVTVEDPRDIVDNYAEFPSWEEMPGFGVCGFSLTKPAA